MAHLEQLLFVESVKRRFGNHFVWARVLEVGSLDINGGSRKFFQDCDYTGIDVAPGRGVDVVCEGQNFFDTKPYDTVISTEAMEHNPYWAETFENMIKLTRPGGLIVMTCATTGRPEHGTSRTTPEYSPLTVGKGWEYYRNLTEEDFRTLDLSDMSLNEFSVNTEVCDLYYVGVKGE